MLTCVGALGAWPFYSDDALPSRHSQRLVDPYRGDRIDAGRMLDAQRQLTGTLPLAIGQLSTGQQKPKAVSVLHNAH